LLHFETTTRQIGSSAKRSQRADVVGYRLLVINGKTKVKPNWYIYNPQFITGLCFRCVSSLAGRCFEKHCTGERNDPPGKPAVDFREQTYVGLASSLSGLPVTSAYAAPFFPFIRQAGSLSHD
jgi:hypothetical protein